MHEERLLRIGREMFLVALGMPVDQVESWVIDRLTSILVERDFFAKQTLFSAGEPLESLFFVRDGEIRFIRGGAPSWTLRGRAILGSFEVLSERPASHTAIAVRDFPCMSVPAAAWVELLEDSVQLARQAIVNSSRALTRLEERIPYGAPRSAQGPTALSIPGRGALTLVERLALLLDSRVLRLAGVQTLTDLAAVSRERSFAAGERIVERGVELDTLVRIVDGEVVAERAAPDVVRFYGPGDLVCGAAILGRVAEDWRARATRPTRGISIPVAALFDLMEEHFDLVRSVLAALGARRQLLLEHLATEPGEVVVT
jgi:CRP-like cAMP-binding protein